MNRPVERRPTRAEWERRRAWARLVADLEARLAEVLSSWTPPRPALREDAVDRLDRVHRTTQARLLREAAELSLARQGDGRLWTAGPGRPNYARWRRDVAREIALALADGRRVTGHLLACQLLLRESWPPVEVLVRAARRWLPGPRTELLFARARFVAGHRREAEVRYLALARAGRWLGGRAHEAAAAAAEARGDLRLALDRNLVARALGAGLRAEASAFVQACVLGERQIAVRLADELDERDAERRVAPRDHARVVREVAARWRARGQRPRPAAHLSSFVDACAALRDRGLADLCRGVLS